MEPACTPIPDFAIGHSGLRSLAEIEDGLSNQMLRAYLRGIVVTALQSSWKATNGIAGAAIAGVAMIWPGILIFIPKTFEGAQPTNWLFSFILYAMLAWTILFFIQLIFFAPYQLHKRDQRLKSENSASAEASRHSLIVKHDKKLADELRKIFPEGQKQRLESDLLGEHAYWGTQSNMLIEGVHFLELAETHFLEDEVRKRAEDFVNASAALLNFMAYKFFVYPNDQRESPLRFAMQPSWNIDRDGNGSIEQHRKYEALTKQLEAHVEQMADTYDKLIEAFHTQLLD
jgi:hypothetical protein